MTKRNVYIALSLITLILFWFSKDTGIFWDNVIDADVMLRERARRPATQAR